MGVSPLPPGTGMAVGFFTGLAVGLALGPIGLLALPFIFQFGQKVPIQGGQSDIFGETIIIPVDETGENLADVFTRAPYFMIIRGNNKEVIQNPYKDIPGNAAVQVTNMLLQYRPAKVIVRNIGRNAERLLSLAGVQIEKR